MKSKTKIIPLLKLKDDDALPKGHWSSNSSFSIMATIFEWKKRPSEFGICTPKDDLTMMVAYMATKADMDAWDRKLADDAAELAGLKR